jgi:hypothetical protein
MNGRKREIQNSFISALKKQDYDVVISLLIEEVGFILKNDRQLLINIIRESGGRISDSISDDDLALKVTYGLLNKNRAFIEKLSRAILKPEHTNADGAKVAADVISSPDTALADGISKGIGAIGKGVGRAAYGKKTDKARKESEEIRKRAEAIKLAKEIVRRREEAKIDAMIVQSESNLQAEKEKEKKKIPYILGAGIIISASIFLIYKLSSSSE